MVACWIGAGRGSLDESLLHDGRAESSCRWQACLTKPCCMTEEPRVADVGSWQDSDTASATLELPCFSRSQLLLFRVVSLVGAAPSTTKASTHCDLFVEGLKSRELPVCARSQTNSAVDGNPMWLHTSSRLASTLSPCPSRSVEVTTQIESDPLLLDASRRMDGGSATASLSSEPPIEIIVVAQNFKDQTDLDNDHCEPSPSHDHLGKHIRDISAGLRNSHYAAAIEPRIRQHRRKSGLDRLQV